MDLLKTANDLIRAEAEYNDAEVQFKKAADKYTTVQHEFDEVVATIRNRWYKKFDTTGDRK